MNTIIRTTRLKYVAKLSAGGTPPVADERCWESSDGNCGVPWAAIADLTREPVLEATARRVSDFGIGRARLTVGHPGTLLFAMYASLGTMGRLAVPACWNQAIVGVAPRPGNDSRFVEYVLEALRPQLARWARSNTQDNLNAEQVGNLPFPAVSGKQQREVVAFLDRECARLTAIRGALSESIALAEEWWLARSREVIGIGRFPSVPVRYFATPGSGHTPSRTRTAWWEPQDCIIPWFTLADVGQIRDDAIDVVTETTERISKAGMANSSAVLHPAQTVLLSRTASVGYSAIMGVDMAVSQDFMTWTCGPRLCPRYLLYTLRAVRPELRRLMYGSTHKTIYMHDLLALRCPLPSIEEQCAVVELLDELSAQRRALFVAEHELRGQLSEYRDALITEAVTGQLDVGRVSDAQMDERMHEAIEAPTA